MNSWIVIDSGVLIASVIEETYTEQADDLLEWIDRQNLKIVAPMLLRYEVAATLRKLVYRGSIEAEDGARLLTQILGKPLELVADATLIERSYALSTEHNLPSSYDAQYLAVAERLGCAFWTFDRRLFNTLNQQLDWIHYVPNFTLPEV